jgi:hypothetical protein
MPPVSAGQETKGWLAWVLNRQVIAPLVPENAPRTALRISTARMK